MAFRAAETKPGLSDIFHVISREDYGSKGLHVVERLLLNSAVKLHRKKIHRVGIPVPSPPIAKLGLQGKGNKWMVNHRQNRR